ncbi:MlaD family protein [Rhodococcus chondri]|uniref:MlaD family protein n=1 Tax=Rhodococcus chondri TaxID=3065941 RepID=A0ABU7JVE5_9NOCA|nr:MlaD family protein [Rhodococcus sp. CC-R104]MEE2033894.1 MlaD family protein [Rhodococcus sp. CC-R104]
MIRTTTMLARRIRLRSVEDYSSAVLGTATVLAIVVALACTLVFARAGLGETTYEAEFVQAAQISSGDAVTVAGVQVGTVEGARLEDDHVVVGMKIDKEVRLGADTSASIKLTTLLGSRYIELRPAGEGDLPDRRITLHHTVVPYDLQEVLADATTTFEEVDAERLGTTLVELSNEFEGVPALVPRALTNVEKLSGVVADRREQIGSLLTATHRLTEIVRTQQASLGSLVRDGRDMVHELALRQNLVERLLASTTDLVRQLHSVVVDDRAAIDELIGALDEMLRSLSNQDELLRNTLQILPVPLRNFTNATGTGNEVDFTSPSGPFIDSWMCAISGHADQLDLPPYFGECR